MANTKKYFKDLYPDFFDRTLILKTAAWIYYVWKDGECKCYQYNKDKSKPAEVTDYDSYEKIVVEKGIKKPLYLLAAGAYWSVPALVINDFGDYLGMITPYVRGIRVKDFKEKEMNMVQATSHSYYGNRTGYEIAELRMYKDRKTLRVHYWVFNDNTYIRFINNPKYKNGEGHRYYGSLFGESLTSAQTRQALASQDADGNYEFLQLSDEELKEYATTQSKSNCQNFCNYTFWESDYRKGYIQEVRMDDRCHGEVLKLSDETRDIIANFYKDLDSNFKKNLKSYYHVDMNDFHYMDEISDMLRAASAEQTAKLAQRKKDRDAIAKEYLNSVEFGPINTQMNLERRGDEILIYTHRSCRGYWGYRGKAMVVYNTKKKTKRLFIEDNNEVSIPVPSWDTIDGWFNLFSYGWKEDLSKVTRPAFEFIPSYEEVIKGTNLEYLHQNLPDNTPIYKSMRYLPNTDVLRQFNIRTLNECLGTPFFTVLALYILIGDKTPMVEQMLKSNYLNLFLTYISSTEGFKDVTNTRYTWGDHRIGYNPKATNLKKCFNLSKAQLEYVNEYIGKELEAEYHDRERDYYSRKPLLPAVYQMDEVLHTEVKCLDLQTFKDLIEGVSHQRMGEYNWFSWNRLNEYKEVCKLFEHSQPSVFMDWLKKGYNVETYNDYLKMRSKLQLISENMHQPEIFNEDGFPVTVSDRAELQRLHDLAAKLTMEYQNVAKTKMFNSALSLAREFEWKDKDSQEDGMQIVAPNSMADLVKEGTCLHHCLKSSMWVDAVADRKSVILFLRRKTDVNTPYFSIEMSPDGSIRQCHGMSNSNPDQNVINFLGRWAAGNKRVNKNSIKSNYGCLCAPR